MTAIVPPSALPPDELADTTTVIPDADNIEAKPDLSVAAAPATRSDVTQATSAEVRSRPLITSNDGS